MGLAKFILMKIILPLSLLSCASLRFNLFSALYLFSFLFILPLRESYDIVFPYLCLLLGLSTAFTLSNIITQITIVIHPHRLKNCSHIFVRNLHQIGITNLRKTSFAHKLRLVLPDVLIIVICIICIVLSRKFHRTKRSHMRERRDSIKQIPSNEKFHTRLWSSWLYQRIKIILNLTTSGFVGIICPSVLNLTYLLIFLVVCTLWASGFNFTSVTLSYVRVFVLTYSGIHIMSLYANQLEVYQTILKDGDLINRLLGFYYYVNSSCKLHGSAVIVKQRIIDIMNPFVLCMLYYIYSLDSKIWIEKEVLQSMATFAKESRTLRSDRQSNNISVLNNGDESNKNISRPLISSLINSFIRNSYILTFIAMMAWSVTYMSWLTFMLLVLASILWLIPDSRKACLYMSPVIVGYAIILILLNYIANLNAIELYILLQSVYIGDLSELGLTRWDLPFFLLSFTIGYLVIFLLTLKLFSKERKKLKMDQLSSIQNPRYTKFRDDVLFRNFVAFIQKMCAKYWIFVCYVILITVSIQKKVKACYIIYIILMTYFITVFMFSYSFWRKQMYTFWWVVVVYSLTILFGIYTYQFKVFQNIWHNYTTFSDRTLTDFGFEIYTTTSLFVGLFIPVVFLVVTIIQVHYFHQSFMVISDLAYDEKRSYHMDGNIKVSNLHKSTSSMSAYSHNFVISSVILLLTKWRQKKSREDTFVAELNYFVNDVNSAFNLLSRNLTNIFNNIYLKIWRLLEVHSTKALVICVMYYMIKNVNAGNFILVVIIVFLYPFPNLHGLLVFLTFITLSTQLIFLMLYQLSFANIEWRSNCSHLKDVNEKFYPNNMNNMEFLGLIKTENFRNFSWFLVLNLIVCSLWFVIKYHQIRYFNLPKSKRPERGIIFSDFSIANLDDTLLSFTKFALNFAFYKLGLELCFIITVINAYMRSDVMSIVYLVLLVFFLPSSRVFCSKLWIPYSITLTLLIPIQYTICLGFLPIICKDYPQKLIYFTTFIFQPHESNELNVAKLFGDMLQWLFVISQHHVFLIEKSTANYKGGDNRPILTNEVPSPKEKDFMCRNDSYSAYIKQLVFYWFYWLSLAVLFLNGIMRNTVYCFGYMILATIYFWTGQKIMLKKRKYLLSMWNVILFYNFCIILIKCLVYLIGCVLMSLVIKHSICWIIPLFGIVCKSLLVNIQNNTASKNECISQPAGLEWDIICFILLILQRKVFISKLFCFVVLHLQIQNKFASRGAQLISRRLRTILKEEKNKENRVFAKIQAKILKIEQTHQNYGKPLPNEHYLVLRSGDYFLFGGNPEDEDNEYEEDDLDSLMSCQLDSASETKITSIPNKSNLKILKNVDESNSSEKIDSSISVNVKSSKVDYTKIGTIGAYGHKANVRKQDNINNEKSKSHTDYFVINPQRLSSSSDESYHTPMTVNNETLTKKPNSVQFAAPVILNKKYTPFTPIEPETQDKIERSQSLSDIISDSREDGCWSKCKDYCRSLYGLFSICLSGAIKWVNRLTRDSRYVSMMLDNEKQMIREKIISYADGTWIGKESNQIYVLTSQGQTLGIEYTMEAYMTTTADIFKRKYRVVELLSIDVETFENQQAHIENFNNVSKVNEVPSKNQEEKSKRSKFFLLMVAFGNLFVINSEILCYIMLVFNYMKSFNVISLVYPLSVFLWAMLSVPRPSTFYWMFIILYTQMVIVTKYIFQFNFIDFNRGNYALEKSSPFFFPVIMGIDKTEYYAFIDLIQLLVLFLHRGYLKDNGLWKSLQEKPDREKKLTDKKIEGIWNKTMVILFWPCNTIKKFYNEMVTYRYSKRVDFYVYMFVCEFLSFFIIVLGYRTFGSGTGTSSDAIDFIKENKVPPQFILMLVVQFIFMITDRALFLRKQVTGKLIFLIFHVLLIHVWIFFLNPFLSRRKFNSNAAPQLLYFFKCLYFGLSAYQIKSGYPLRILGNFLTKRYNYVNLFLFKAYMVIPFLYELRNVMDWIWTDTSVSLYHWMEVEDVFTKIFVIKCWRRAELEYPTHRGTNRWYVSKVLVGGFLMSFFFICLWGPLSVGTIIGATFVINDPKRCISTLEVDGHAYLYQFTSRNQNLMTMGKEKVDQIRGCYNENLEALNYFKAFDAEDVTLMKLGGYSENSWIISPPNLKTFLFDLGNPLNQPNLSFILMCDRAPKDTKNTIVSVSVTYSRRLTDKERKDIIQMIVNPTTSGFVVLDNIIPKFIIARKTTMHFVPENIVLDDLKMLSVTISLKNKSDIRWWQMDPIPYGNCTRKLDIPLLSLYILSERISESLFGQLFSRYGILGMYAAYILVAHRVLRAIYADISYIIRCEELPYVDRILILLNEIYLVRENKMFRLEEQLVAKLIFLYRSSETMIKWTRHKQSTLNHHKD